MKAAHHTLTVSFSPVSDVFVPDSDLWTCSYLPQDYQGQRIFDLSAFTLRLLAVFWDSALSAGALCLASCMN